MRTSTRSSGCPMCEGIAVPLVSFDLAPKPPLPQSVFFRWCSPCDFIFAEQLDVETYRQFYRSELQDTAHVSDACTADNLRSIQAQLIAGHLGADFRGNCLDFGAGEGQLLSELAKRLPHASLFGADLRNSLRPGTPARFLKSLDGGPRHFDLIILSHVAEHLVDLHDLSRLVGHLAPAGLIYIEVPDPLGYPACPRREFMYYFDRLHINHFSQNAINRWLSMHSLRVTKRGSHQFSYRDGLYPAQFVFASQGGAGPSPRQQSSIRQAFDTYRTMENARSSRLRDLIRASAGPRDLIVYGHGDNYFRARARGGPLQDLPIKAVLDRKAATLAESEQQILLPEIGLVRYPDAVVLLTVSAGADTIKAGIRLQNSDRKVIVI